MTQDEYHIAMKRIDVLMLTPEGEMTVEQNTELQLLAANCEAYEDIHYPICGTVVKQHRDY
jgi:antitoxin component HigA of HigAB toxin-antitoxin module